MLSGKDFIKSSRQRTCKKTLSERIVVSGVNFKPVEKGNSIQVSFATIYRAIYAGMLDEKRLSHGERCVVRKLRHRGKTHHRKGTEETRGKLKISNPIEKRLQ